MKTRRLKMKVRPFTITLMRFPGIRLVEQTEQKFRRIRVCLNPNWTILNKIFRQFYPVLHAFSRNNDMLSPKSTKTGPKKQREFSVLSVFVHGHFIPLVSKLGQSGHSIF